MSDVSGNGYRTDLGSFELLLPMQQVWREV